jgi:hypothetical protein
VEATQCHMQCGTVRRLLKRKDKTGKRRATPEHGGMVGQLPLEQHIGVRILAVSLREEAHHQLIAVRICCIRFTPFRADWSSDVYCGLVLASHLRQQVADRRMRCIHLGSGCPHKRKAGGSFVTIECRGSTVKPALSSSERACDASGAGNWP